jgi:diaminopimelate decarboxylase
VRTAQELLASVARLEAKGIEVRSLDLGGGFAANYDSTYEAWSNYAGPLTALLLPFVQGGGRVIFEPGRTLVANAAVLLTQVQYTKHAGDRRVALVDAGMTDLIRPAMYDAYHFIWPTGVAAAQVPQSYAPEPSLPGLERWDVAGPICESSDYFARDRMLPPLNRGDTLAIFGTGAYGMVMANRYNARPLPAEVLVDGHAARLIRRRETYDDLITHEVD